MHRHFSMLAVSLSIAMLSFIACALGLISHFQNVALICGTILVLFMTVGFFYATLHLQNVH